MTKKLIYLATPYSDDDPAVREARFHSVSKAASELMRGGLYVFSPISHTHPIAKAGALPLGWDYWEGYDRAILQTCSLLVVLKLPGWDKSKGVAGELRIAEELGIPIRYIEPAECTEAWAQRLREEAPGYREAA